MALIQKINVNGSVYNIAATAYTTCTTAAGTTAKVISLSGLVIQEGVTIHVKFAEGNTASNPTLTVDGALSSTGTDASTTAIAIMSHGTTRVGTTIGASSWRAGEVVSLTYDGTNWIADYNEDTTYTFSGGTNKFTYTPAGGTAQDVTITPSIANNITGTGTRTQNYLVKFSGQNTITNLVQISNSIETQTSTTKFLREDGTWQVPSYPAASHYTANLVVGDAATDQSNEAVTASATGVYLNLVENSAVNNSHQLAGAGGITIGSDANGKITFTGKAGTVTSVGVTANGGLETSITNSGAITTSGTIGIAAGGVTNAMLANDWIKIGDVTKHLGETFALSDLGIARAMNFIGITKTQLTDGATTSTLEAKTSGSLSKTTNFVLGDVVLYGDAEFIWTGSAWELLGDETAYAPKSTAVTNVAWDGTNNKLTKTINGSTTDIVTISTLKTALNFTKSDLSLDNVTNHAQVTSLQWDTTNKKITYKVSEGSATNVVAFAAGSSGRVTLTAAANKLTIEAADTRVKQSPLAYNGTNAGKEYAVLFKTTGDAYTEETGAVKFASTENKRVTINPSTGTLTAAQFVGALQATDVKTALGINSNSTALTFLHESGTWKTLALDVSDTATANVSVSVASVDTQTATLMIHSNLKIVNS